MQRKNIKLICLYKDILLKDLAKKCNMDTKNFLTQLAKDNLREKMLSKIANNLNCTLEYLWIDKDSNTNLNENLVLSQSEVIKNICKSKKILHTDLAHKIGTTPQNFTNKLTYNDFKENTLLEIATALNCTLTIKWIDKETGKEFY